MVNGPVASVVLPVSLRDAWPYFREPDLIVEWHGWEYDGGGLDKEVKQIYLDEARVGEDHRRIHVGTHFFDFEEEAGATRVDVHRAPSSEDDNWREYLPDIDEGWLSFLQQLRFRLERHQADSRRTIFVSGTPRDPTISPIEMVGLGQVVLQEIGAVYGATVGPGDALTGNLWFVSANQIGGSVDAWGDGLLIVANGPAGGPPYVASQAILTTYGLDEDERAALADRWTQWWSRHYVGGST